MVIQQLEDYFEYSKLKLDLIALFDPRKPEPPDYGREYGVWLTVAPDISYLSLGVGGLRGFGLLKEEEDAKRKEEGDPKKLRDAKVEVGSPGQAELPFVEAFRTIWAGTRSVLGQTQINLSRELFSSSSVWVPRSGIGAARAKEQNQIALGVPIDGARHPPARNPTKGRSSNCSA